MKPTEQEILQEITRLFTELDSATYGTERTNGRIVPPDSCKFYYNAKRLYEVADELVEKYQPTYITRNDYRFIYDSQRPLLLELDALRDRKKLQEDYLTRELEKYLLKIQGLFSCVLSYCKNVL